MVLQVAVALAFAVVEPHSGFEFDIPPEMECVYLPRGQLAGQCSPMDELQRRQFEAGGVALFALDASGGMLIGYHAAAPAAKMTDVALDQFIGGVASGMEKQTGAKFNVNPHGNNLFTLEKGDTFHAPVAFFEFVASPDSIAKKPQLAFVNCAVFPARSGLLTFQRVSAQRDGVLLALVRSVKTPADFPDMTLFARNRAYRLGSATAQLTCIGAMILLVGWFVRRQMKKASSSTSHDRGPSPNVELRVARGRGPHKCSSAFERAADDAPRVQAPGEV